MCHHAHQNPLSPQPGNSQVFFNVVRPCIGAVWGDATVGVVDATVGVVDAITEGCAKSTGPRGVFTTWFLHWLLLCSCNVNILRSEYDVCE